ncbi:MAG: hypothetical protein RR554_11915 [Vagococcus sp.]|uniref:hypothetical protein n=1 Tax=Vagococcus sp. TaxID=1933889 RepID=UPI002FCB0828
MKRVAINFIIFLFADLGTFFVKHLLSIDGGVVRIIGLVVLVLAIAYLVLEKRMNLPSIYGRSQSGGSNANGAAVLGVACGLVVIGTTQLVIGLVIGLVIILLVNKLVATTAQ